MRKHPMSYETNYRWNTAMGRIAVAVLLAVAWSAADARLAQTDVQRLERFIEAYAQDQRFMGSVLVAQDGTPIFDKAFGYADAEWNIPNSPTTKFRLGSITKQFTAVAILLLKERGALRISDSVTKHMPDAPTAWAGVTIFNLLTHTSGITNYTALPDDAQNGTNPRTPEQLIGLFRDRPLEFSPGERFSYSNSNYVLLGYLIEKISGLKYAEFLQQNIFLPIGMNDTGYDSHDAIIERRASGYMRRPTGLQNARYIDISGAFAAGGLYSTTRDLLRWESALFGGKVLSSASLEEMLTPFKNGYALGVEIRTAGGHRCVWHGGTIVGFNTAMAFYPDEKVTVIVLGNVEGVAPWEIEANMARVALGEKVVLPFERTEINVDSRVLDRYKGRYALGERTVITVDRDGAHLSVQFADQGTFDAFAESERRFFHKVFDAQIEFEVDAANGRPTALVLHQMGRELRAPRIPDETISRPTH